MSEDRRIRVTRGVAVGEDRRIRVALGLDMVRVSWMNASNGLGARDLVRHIEGLVDRIVKLEAEVVLYRADSVAKGVIVAVDRERIAKLEAVAEEAERQR
jgi:hypothetical protein